MHSQVAGASSTDPAICAQIRNSVGIYYVETSGKPTFKKLHAGTQSIRPVGSNWIYFVVGENDGRPETVDHFRIMTTEKNGNGAENLDIGLDRNAVNSDCYSSFQKWLLGYGSESHSYTSLDHYDKRLQAKYKNVDNKLNAWHFFWNVAPRGAKRLCDYTAANAPSIRENGVAPSGAKGVFSPAIAGIISSVRGLPLNVTSLKMVLVHRREDQNNCLGVRLDFGGRPDETRIDRLRFSNRKQRFSGGGPIIDWIK
jgi:hypothetical protein